jgi:hypothetical protein
MKKILCALILLAGCDQEERPQAPTPAEAARLDEAEDMLNELAANEAGPANAEAPTGPKHRADEQPGQ